MTLIICEEEEDRNENVKKISKISLRFFYSVNKNKWKNIKFFLIKSSQIFSQYNFGFQTDHWRNQTVLFMDLCCCPCGQQIINK